MEYQLGRVVSRCARRIHSESNNLFVVVTLRVPHTHTAVTNSKMTRLGQIIIRK